MDALEHGLIVEQDSRLAYQLLRDIGVIPTIGQAIQPQHQEPLSDEDARVRQTMIKLASVAIQRNKIFSIPLPDADGVENEIEEELARREQNEK